MFSFHNIFQDQLKKYIKDHQGCIVNRDGLCFIDFITLDFAEFVDFANAYDDRYWSRPDVQRFFDCVITFVDKTLVVSSF